MPAYTFDEQSVKKLQRDHQRLAYQVRNLHEQLTAQRQRVAAAPQLYCGKTTSIISALSSSTPGSGTAKIYQISGSTGDLQQVTPSSVTVHNIGGLVADDTYAIFGRDAWGTWWLLVVPCE